MQIMHISLIFDVEVLVVYISHLVLLFLTFCMSGFFYYFLFFFKVNSGVFLSGNTGSH